MSLDKTSDKEGKLVLMIINYIKLIIVFFEIPNV